MTNIIGTDVSFYQDNNETPQTIDFKKMKSNGAEFAIIRAGQNLWPDPDFATNWQRAKEAGLPRGSYWFYDGRVEPEKQAELYASMFNNDFGELLLFADFENLPNENTFPFKGYKNWKKFLDKLKSMIPASKEIGIYTGFYYWEEQGIPVSEQAYFSQYPLWIANYNPIENPPIPEDTWSDWLFWQYTDKGDGKAYGAESNRIDLNYFNGDKAEFYQRFNLDSTPVPLPEPEKPINTHHGVRVWNIVRFGAKCIVHEIDPKVAQVFVTPGPFDTVSNAVKRYDSQIGMNGGGWPNVQTPGHRTNEIWVSGGNILQATALDDRGYINVDIEGKPRISKNDALGTDLRNTWGFDRILGENGKFNDKISDRVTKDARTGSGITADNKIVILSAEGDDRYQRGLTFPEMWSVLSEFGSIIAGNNDGGSSSAVINLALSNQSLIIPSDGPGKEARVINQVLIFATPTGETIPPDPEPPTGGNMKNYSVIAPIKPRPKPEIAGGTRPDLPKGYTFQSDTEQDGKPVGTRFVQLPDGDWVPLVYNGTTYVVAGGDIPDPEPLPPGERYIVLHNEDGTTEEFVPKNP